MGQYYMFPYLQHAQNKWLFFSWGKDIMVDMVVLRYLGGDKKICNLLFFLFFAIKTRSSSHWLWGHEVVPILKGEEHSKKALEQECEIEICTNNAPHYAHHK